MTGYANPNREYKRPRVIAVSDKSSGFGYVLELQSARINHPGYAAGKEPK